MSSISAINPAISNINYAQNLKSKQVSFGDMIEPPSLDCYGENKIQEMSRGNELLRVFCDKNGKKTEIHVFDKHTKKMVEEIKLYEDGKFPEIITRFHRVTGNKTKKMRFYEDGGLRYIAKYDANNGRLMKEVGFWSDGSPSYASKYNSVTNEMDTEYFPLDE